VEVLRMKSKLIAIIVVCALVAGGASVGLYIFLRGGGEKGAEKIPQLKPPVAFIEASATRIIENGTITFNSSRSLDPDGEIVNYIWDFGDGYNSETNFTNVTHRYEKINPEGDPYIVNLTVIDDNSQKNSATLNITVIPKPLNENEQVFLLSRDNPVFDSGTNVSFEKHPFNANFTFNITILGISAPPGVSANLTLTMYDPDSQEILSRDYDVTLSEDDNINLSFEEIEKTGTYNIDIVCGRGTVQVKYVLEVKYW